MKHMTAPVLAFAVLASPAPLKAQSAAAAAARRAPECASRVPLEFSQSIALPVRAGKGLRYRIMFYRAAGNGPMDPNPQVGNYIIAAEFDVNGADVSCDVAVDFPKPKRRTAPLGDQMSAATRKLSYQAYQQREGKLYAAIQEAAEAFAAGRKDAKAAAAFRRLFEEHAEPALKEHYRAMAPEFLAWADAPGKK